MIASRFFRLAGMAALLFAGGCASTGQWSNVAAKPPVPLKVSTPQAAAALLSMPGDICLLHLSDSPKWSLTKQLGVYPAGVMDLLALQDPIVKFLHSEIVTDTTPNRIRTKGFFPFAKSYEPNQFERSYAVYGMTDFPAKVPFALNRAASGKWAKTGYCGDFVAWCYDDEIYSWWNRAPYVQDVFGTLYPPEAIHTADHIANSPDTKLLIEIQDNELIYPKSVRTAELVARLNAAGRSGHPLLVQHAKDAFDVLKRNRIVGPNGQVLQSMFRIEIGR